MQHGADSDLYYLDCFILLVACVAFSNRTKAGAGIIPSAPTVGAILIVRPVDPADDSNHFTTDLNCLDYDGEGVLANEYFYRAEQVGIPADRYVYALAYFGNGHGRYPSGTGYAVMEILNPNMGTKVIATWERYKAAEGANSQVPMLTAQEWIKPPTKTDNVCWIGDVTTNGLMSPDPKQMKQALKALKTGGWRF